MIGNLDWSTMTVDGITMEQINNFGEYVEERETCKDCAKSIPVLGFIIELYEKYDGTFLTMLGMQYFN